jgi:peptidoglycan/xylan/chitin deacetylase (PgdA/CDA1 family)
MHFSDSFVYLFTLLLITTNIINAISNDVLPELVFAQSLEPSKLASQGNINNDDNNDEKIPILTFDDGVKGQIDYAKTILDKYGFPATFSVICNNVSQSGYMNWNEIRQLQDDGYDIASHTMNHDNLEEMSFEQAKYEISESKKCLLNNGIKDVKVFTYPKNGGSEDPKIIEEVSNHYEIARTGTEPLSFLDCSYSSANSNNNHQLTSLQNKVSCTFQREQDKYTIEGWSHDAERKDFGYKDEELLKRFIDVVNSQSDYNENGAIKAIPVIIYHDINQTSGYYETSVDLFEKEMKYLKEHGFKIMRLLDLI